MSVEAPQGEDQPKDPVQEAQEAFSNALFGEYDGRVLVASIHRLHNALLEGIRGKAAGESGEARVRMYHELTVVSSLAESLAERKGDPVMAEDLRTLQRGFESTYEAFSPRMQATAAQPVQPTRTEYLPPMTGAKGGEARPQRQVATNTQIPPATPVSTPETPTAIQKPQASPTEQQPDVAQQEETFGSFLKQKRAEAGLSQANLGKAAGNLSQGVISAIERGGTLLSDPDKVSQLALALGLSEEDTQKFTDLYNKQNPPEPQ